MFNFEKLEVWHKSNKLADEVELPTQDFPHSNQFSLGEQLRRASLAVGTNIAEGCGRNSKREFRYFLNIAKGSVYEVAGLLFRAKDRGFCSKEKFNQMYKDSEEIAKMLSSLMKTL